MIHKINKHYFNKGFSIIEILVVITVIGIIGYVLSDLLTRSFQGSNKTAVIGDIKYTGQVTLDSISREIRTADKIVCSGSDVLTLQPNYLSGTVGKYIRFKFSPGTPGFIQEDFPGINSAVLSQNYCDSAKTEYTSTSDKKDLIDISSTGQVSLASGSFSVNTEKTAVTIQFTLSPRNQSASTFDYQLGSANNMEFNTTVQVRK